MPRAIVFVNGESWKFTRDKLNEMFVQKDTELLKKYATITEFYLEAFGNPDFVVSLWSTNLEYLKAAVLYIREKCNAKTSSIVGVESTEKTSRISELNELVTDCDSEGQLEKRVMEYISDENSKLSRIKQVFKH